MFIQNDLINRFINRNRFCKNIYNNLKNIKNLNLSKLILLSKMKLVFYENKI